jgi:hypothetical protein
LLLQSFQRCAEFAILLFEHFDAPQQFLKLGAGKKIASLVADLEVGWQVSAAVLPRLPEVSLQKARAGKSRSPRIAAHAFFPSRSDGPQMQSNAQLRTAPGLLGSVGTLMET